MRFGKKVILVMIIAVACRGKTNREAKDSSTVVLAEPDVYNQAPPMPANLPKGPGTESRFVPASQMPKLTPEHYDVIKRLAEGMLRIPEVAKKSDEMMNGVSRDRTISDQAALFDKWLIEYMNTHPTEVAKAREEQTHYKGLPDVRHGIIVGPQGPTDEQLSKAMSVRNMAVPERRPTKK